MKTIRIGTGAGYAGDRIEPAIELIEKGNIDYIIFECLAERTIAIAQEQKLKNPNKGYNDLLEYRMEKILSSCQKNNVKIITNMGAANPIAAAKITKKIAEEKGLRDLKIASVLGDDVLEKIDKYMGYKVLETGEELEKLKGQIVSANAYLGIDGILEALENGADIIITGRVADPALFLAPLVYEFNWGLEDYEIIGKGIIIGHLLECGGQVTGGYYADPDYKDVERLWELGFPIAEVKDNGDAIITKVEGSGGKVSLDTCKEQLLYEIHDPSQYLTPDGIADFTNLHLKEVEKDKVSIKGGKGAKRPDKLKVSIGYKDCFIGVGEISYGGSGAVKRAKLAAKIVQERLEMQEISVDEIRYDLIGINSLYGNVINIYDKELNEVRLRISARTNDKDIANKVVNEVEALYTNGPAGGGGAEKSIKEIVSVASIFIPRNDVDIKVMYEEV
ncbi:acyclic terpene utilization AtuA family protein [Anaerosalibacter massiliensis]|uniref:DUF1446 domain-containing protein n=1 Tax=Anaerosalibacter massiliensis TaxID=1347392 RepID=A0A9X2MHS6_9FIRM|nr:acyclic terpene utilization AtuA family protein [Anaerosalibacter massiliensis]MCR2045382.1 DUF1446 domain-containing protein [Anaerosalibacter massiliensis]